MIDIYKYIVSKDTVEYLKEINYQFSAFQMVSFILNDWKHYSNIAHFSLKQKHDDLRTIMSECEDEMMTTRESYELGKEKSSLFEMIREKIEHDERLLDEFYNGKGFFDLDHHCLFENFEKLKSFFDKEYDLDETETIEIEKRTVDSERIILAAANKHLEPVLIRDIDPDPEKETLTRIDYMLGDDCYKPVPLPFKNGDIVTAPGSEENGPMIIMCDEYEKERKGEDRFRIFGEYDPECINCFYYGNGFLYFEHMVPTKLERYRGEKTREYELLVVLQKYIRGEIDFTTFLPAHQAALGNLGLLKGMTDRYYYGEAILKEYILGEKHGSKNNQS